MVFLLHHDQYWLDMLLEASSKGATDELCAIGVDPVEESAGPLERIAMDEASNNRCSIMLAAVGDEELDRVSLWCLPHMARQSLREELVGRGVDTVTKAAVDKQMAYMENMSGIHSAHPAFARSVEWVRHMCHTPHATNRGTSCTHAQLRKYIGALQRQQLRVAFN